MIEKFAFSYWGILLPKLNALEEECDRIENLFSLDADDCADIEETARENAEYDIRGVEYPFSSLTEIICKAKMEALMYKICSVKHWDESDFVIDVSNERPRLIYKGDEL